MLKKRFKDYFIPSEENNYTPHGFQKVAMLGMVLLVILSFTATNVQSLIWTSSQWMVSTILPAVIVDLTNQEREAQSLGTLTRNPVLDAAAKLKARDMAENEYFAHYSPDGISPWYWFNEVSYNFVHAGENLAIYFTDSNDVVDAWMESPTHRANIVNSNYTEIGVGTAAGTYEGYPTVYVVQLFGTPAAAPVVANIEEPSPAPVAAPIAVQKVEPQTQDTEVLAESVSISEEIVVIPAEAVPVTVEEDNLLVTTQNIETTVIDDMETQGGTVVLYSDLIATSTGGVAATVDTTKVVKTDTTPFYLSLATQPHKILQILYIVIGLFVLISLLASIIIEIRHQQPMQIAYSVGLMTLMFALFYIHTVLSSGALVV